MKKILFLSYNYPRGIYGASTQCTLRIMSELASHEDIEVHCASYEGEKDVYSVDERIIQHRLKIRKERSYPLFLRRIIQIIFVPIYPLNHASRHLKHLVQVSKLCKANHFDVVVSQCYPQESVLVGACMKKRGLIDKHVVIYWDNIYGKNPARFIPISFALRRQKKLESWIAKYSDKLVSLYPLKSYHDKYGDVPEAEGKRVYLGIPSIFPPQEPVDTKYKNALIEGKKNVLYSGSIIRPEYMDTVVELLNQLKDVEDINLIFFSRGYSNTEFDQLKKKFKGTIQNVGYIPNRELLSVYNYVDFFMSFPGDINSIRSKCYEYMSYGHPMLLFYNDERDVNISTFSKYPLATSVNIEGDRECITDALNRFMSHKGEKVDFNQVESLYPLDTPKSYAGMIYSVCE